MVAGHQLASILLVCFLSDLRHTTAFPKARRSLLPGPWPQDLGDFGNLPPQYGPAVRHFHEALQSLPVQDTTWQILQGDYMPGISHGLMQPSWYGPTQFLNPPLSAVGPVMPAETLPIQQPMLKPRSYDFNLKFPFADILGQRKEKVFSKGSSLSGGGMNGASFSSELYRPSNVLDHSGEKHPPKNSKANFHFSLSLPGPTPAPSSKIFSKLVGGSLKRPENGGGWLGKVIQQQQGQQLYNPVHPKPSDGVHISVGHSSKSTTPTEQIGQSNMQNSPVYPASLQPHYPAPPLPVSYYAQLPGNVFSGYYSGPLNPASYGYWGPQNGQGFSFDLSWFPSQYKGNGHSSANIKPSNNYGPHPTWSDFAALAFGMFRPTYGNWRLLEPLFLPNLAPPLFSIGSKPPYKQP